MRSLQSHRDAAVRCAASFAIVMFAPFAHAYAQTDTEVLNNAAVVQMVAGKLSKNLITGKINSTRPGFDLSSDGIISLVGFKVDQDIIKLMLQVADNARRSNNAPSTLIGMDEVLTNEIVVRMHGAKVPKQIILAKIQVSRSAFDVTAAGLVSLNTSKVPEDVIKAMMLPPTQAAPAPAKKTSPPTKKPPA